MPPEAYSFSPGAGFSQKCIVAVSVLDEGFLLLGDSFLRSFYSSYDMENSQVRLAVNSDATWPAKIIDLNP